ncbi:hypothetical protein GDO81_019142 [Engystomops pustulosus]|uniref:Uncharacterized protein n=1 Tax=Engystomops pustulosus TaxID=76066 RepID=A0AAV6YKN8_ENGPU|nr:hypothetical protein GDO81_019142 [Engystomops pustulosus]
MVPPADSLPMSWGSVLCEGCVFLSPLSYRMLYDYVTRKRKENQSAQVHVTYLLSGKSLQDGHPVSI